MSKRKSLVVVFVVSLLFLAAWQPIAAIPDCPTDDLRTYLSCAGINDTAMNGGETEEEIAEVLIDVCGGDVSEWLPALDGNARESVPYYQRWVLDSQDFCGEFSGLAVDFSNDRALFPFVITTFSSYLVAEQGVRQGPVNCREKFDEWGGEGITTYYEDLFSETE